jgi:hypothetical protein
MPNRFVINQWLERSHRIAGVGPNARECWKGTDSVANALFLLFSNM